MAPRAPSAPEAWLKSMGLRDSSPTGNKENTFEAMSLDLAQCRDLAQPPTEAGLRRFLTSLQAQASDDDRKVSLRGLQLGSRAGRVLARSLSPGVTALDLHGNGSLGEAGALALLPLLDGGALRSLDLGGCGLGGDFAPALAQHLLRVAQEQPAGRGSRLRVLQLGGAAQGHARPNRLVGAGELMAALQRCCGELEVLGVSHCLSLSESEDAALGGKPPRIFGNAYFLFLRSGAIG